jgi:uncharacterized damage-inducible protein DinB
MSDTAAAAERGDLLETLARHRRLLRQTTQGLDDEQAARRTTVSELCLGGLIKHVARVESRWAGFITGGPEGMGQRGTEQDWRDEFRMLPGETLAGLLAAYELAAERTSELVATLPSLDATQPLPAAPWFKPGETWSARRALLHVIGETAQHAGHADIIREALDGAKTMG